MRSLTYMRGSHDFQPLLFDSWQNLAFTGCTNSYEIPTLWNTCFLMRRGFDDSESLCIFCWTELKTFPSAARTCVSTLHLHQSNAICQKRNGWKVIIIHDHDMHKKNKTDTSVWHYWSDNVFPTVVCHWQHRTNLKFFLCRHLEECFADGMKLKTFFSDTSLWRPK